MTLFVCVCGFGEGGIEKIDAFWKRYRVCDIA